MIWIDLPFNGVWATTSESNKSGPWYTDTDGVIDQIEAIKKGWGLI